MHTDTMEVVEILEFVGELELFSRIMKHDNVVIIAFRTGIQTVELPQELREVVLVVEGVEHAARIEGLSVEDDDRSLVFGCFKADEGFEFRLLTPQGVNRLKVGWLHHNGLVDSCLCSFSDEHGVVLVE